MPLSEIDSVLSSYVRATVRLENERLLEELLIIYGGPIISSNIHRHLGFHVSHDGKIASCSDALDLYYETITKITKRLRLLKEQQLDGEITNYGQYVRRIVRNICADYLRDKYPLRYHLKCKIVYILSNLDRDKKRCFVKLSDQDNGNCDEGQHKSDHTITHDEIIEQVKTLYLERDSRIRKRPGANLAWLIEEVLARISTPLTTDTLVSLIIGIIGFRERVIESIDKDAFSKVSDIQDRAPRADQFLETKERLRFLWEELNKLQVIERRIILLSAVDEEGGDLLSILLESKAIRFSQLLESLEFSRDDLVPIWQSIPMSDPNLARYFDISRGKVAKIRYRARVKLRKALNREGDK